MSHLHKLFILICVIFHTYTSQTQAAQNETDKDWSQAAIDKQNEYRKLHGASPLTLDDDLCATSQKIANLVASTGYLHDDQSGKAKGYGENTYARSGPSNEILPEEPIDYWYNEMKNYDFKTGQAKNVGDVDHFTQIVWKGSTEACVSYSGFKLENNNTRIVVVANYLPQGNVRTLYEQNVSSKAWISNLQGFLWMMSCSIAVWTIYNNIKEGV